MDLDGPRSPDSTSMEIDDSAAASRPDTQLVQPNSSDAGPSDHPFAGPNASSPANDLGEVGDIRRDHDHELVPWRRSRNRLPISRPSTPEAPEPRKRKIMHLSPDPTPDARSSADAAGSSSSARRTRPRLLRTERDREFTPLLIMSPRRELEEETLTTFQYTPIVTDPDSLHSMVRRRHLPLPPLDEHGPRILQSRYSPTADDMEAHHRERRRRLDSTSSFEQVALASTTSASPTTPTTGSLSTLSNLSLPRPFEDGPPPASPPSHVATAATAVEPPSEPARGSTIVKVHERGIDAGPSFPVPSSTRGGLRPSRGAAPFQIHFHFHAHQHAVEQGANPLFDEPLCESPVSFHPGVALSPPRIDPDDVRRVISAPTGCTLDRVPVAFRSLPAV